MTHGVRVGVGPAGRSWTVDGMRPQGSAPCPCDTEGPLVRLATRAPCGENICCGQIIDAYSDVRAGHDMRFPFLASSSSLIFVDRDESASPSGSPLPGTSVVNRVSSDVGLQEPLCTEPEPQRALVSSLPRRETSGRHRISPASQCMREDLQ